MSSRKWVGLLTLFVALAMLTAACGGGQAATPTTSAAAAPTEAPTQAAPTEAAPTEAAATQAPAGEAVSLDLWFHSGRGAERDALTTILDNFAAQNPNITVNAIELPEGSYNDQVQAAAFADTLPCLLDFDGPNMYNYAWGGFLIPLDDYVPADMKADFLPSIINQGTFQDGKLYSLGQFDSGLALYANKQYLQDANVRIPTLDEPWTGDEFMAALNSLKALDGVQYPLDTKLNYGIVGNEWVSYGFTPVIWSYGGSLIDRDTYQTADGYINGQASVDAMSLIQSWYQDGLANPQPAGDTEFTDGVAAISWVGHWAYAGYNDAMGDNLLLLPMPDFGTGPKTGMGSWNWGITSRCANPDAAWTVLDFILQPDQILVMTNANGAVPARRSALSQSELYGPNGFLNLYVEQIDRGWAMPRAITPAYPAITTAFQTAFGNIVDGADVQSEMDKAAQSIDQDIQNNNGYPID
jgi:multiple sugar transport system substrate-binding protein